MPIEALVRLESNDLPARLREAASRLESFEPTENGNPLLKSLADYRLFMTRAYETQRPTVAQSGAFLGNPWPEPDPQYVRKGDGVTVKIYGGQPRAVLKGGRFGAQGAHSRLGVVTPTKGKRGTRQVEGSGMTEAELRAGYRAVRTGQVFSRSTVLGKLKGDGSRYKASDPQLGMVRPGGLLGDFLFNAPVISEGGFRVTAVVSKAGAERQAKKRNFILSPAIEEFYRTRLRENFIAFLRRVTS